MDRKIEASLVTAAAQDAPTSVKKSGKKKILIGLSAAAVSILALWSAFRLGPIDEGLRDGLIADLAALTDPNGRLQGARTAGGAEFQGWMKDGTRNEDLSEMVEKCVDARNLKRLKEDYLNPGGVIFDWGEYVDATHIPPSKVEQWMGQWRAERGDVVTVFLKRDFGAQQGNGRCRLLAIFESARTSWIQKLFITSVETKSKVFP